MLTKADPVSGCKKTRQQERAHCRRGTDYGQSSPSHLNAFALRVAVHFRLRWLSELHRCSDTLSVSCSRGKSVMFRAQQKSLMPVDLRVRQMGASGVAIVVLFASNALAPLP